MAFGPKIDQRKLNKRNHIIDLFREHKTLSKAQAKTFSCYSMETIISIFSSLVKEKLIIPADASEQKKGRKAKYFRLNSDMNLYFGITFNQNGIYSSLVSFSYEVLSTDDTELPFAMTTEVFLETFDRHIEKFKQNHQSEFSAIDFAGCSVPGDIDTETGILHSYALMPYLKEIDFGAILRKHFPHSSIKVEYNITSTTSVLLSQIPIIKNHSKIIYVSVRAGVAMGLIYHGQVVPIHGEMGHVRVSDEPQKCVCGRTGCLDLYFSYRSVAEASAPILGLGVDEITVEDIITAYRGGNKRLIKLIDRRLDYFASALLDAINLGETNLAIVSGKMLTMFDDPAEKIKQSIERQFQDTGYVKNFSASDIQFMNHNADIASQGICFAQIRKEWVYQQEPTES